MKKIFLTFVPLFTVLVLIVSCITPAVKMSEDISGKVFRLHILANSNSDADQALKLRVRDKVLNEAGYLFEGCKSVDEAIEIAADNIKKLKSVAQSVIAFYGYEYDTNVYTTREYFSTRKYDGFTLPAGIYDSLKIEIGEAKGRNWWCVMFPTVCVSGCTDDLGTALTPEEMRMIESDKFIIRFKSVEIYEKLKSKINGD